MTEDPHRLGAVEALRAIERGSLTAEALARACLARIDEREDAVGAWAALDREQVLREARALDREPRRGRLHGLPVGVKDVIDTADYPTEYNSPIYRGHRPRADAAAVAILKREGALVLGKTVTTEFANIHPAATRNPHNPRHTPGGSSSGSAAAVADQMVPLALGTQTAGSVIRPAAYCGVYAIKPSFGAINRGGMKFLAESLDTIGLFARQPEDLALALACLSGKAAAEAADRPPRIGLSRTARWSEIDADARSNLEEAAQRLEAAGASVVDLALPHEVERLADLHTLVMGFESARALAWEHTRHADALSDALRQRLDDGWRVPRTEYDAVRRTARTALQSLANRMESLDFILTPSAPGAAPASLSTTGNSLFNRTWTLLGLPCIAVPYGRTQDGLPLGLQLVGDTDADMPLIAWARWAADRL